MTSPIKILIILTSHALIGHTNRPTGEWFEELTTPYYAGAERVRREAGLPVASSWCIDDPLTAEYIVTEGQMDLVMIGRAHLANPHYPYQMALDLKTDNPAWVLPVSYAHWLSRYKGPGKAAAQ